MFRNIAAAALLALSSCNAEQPIQREIRDDVNGVNFIVEHFNGPALSHSEDKLYLITESERKLILEGYGGSSISLFQLKNDILVAAYCGVSVRRMESILVNDSKSGRVMAVKIQPIITQDVQIKGNQVCIG